MTKLLLLKTETAQGYRAKQNRAYPLTSKPFCHFTTLGSFICFSQKLLGNTKIWIYKKKQKYFRPQIKSLWGKGPHMCNRELSGKLRASASGWKPGWEGTCSRTLDKPLRHIQLVWPRSWQDFTETPGTAKPQTNGKPGCKEQNSVFGLLKKAWQSTEVLTAVAFLHQSEPYS